MGRLFDFFCWFMPWIAFLRFLGPSKESSTEYWFMLSAIFLRLETCLECGFCCDFSTNLARLLASWLFVEV